MKVEIGYYKKQGNGSLKGMFSLVIVDWGRLQIDGCKHFVSTFGSEWFKFPDKEGKPKDDGTKPWFPFMKLQDKDVDKTLQASVLKAISEYKHEVPNVTNKTPSFGTDLLQSDEIELW